MALRDVAEQDVIFIIGSPRSGTTWLAKIFDSHPAVLYRHEPDKILRPPQLKQDFAGGEASDSGDAARAYVRALMSLTDLRTVGILPIFRKSYQYWYLYYARLLALGSLGVLSRLRPPWPEKLRAPDMISAGKTSSIKLVIKSISCLGRVGLFAAAMPLTRIIYIIRDPFGHVASVRRGIELGKFENRIPLEACVNTREAAAYGLTASNFERLTEVERIAWNWAILNEKSIGELAGNPHASIVLYHKLCADPAGQAARLFAAVGLDWNAQTASFVRASTTSNAHNNRYYRIYRNTAAEPERWRRELTLEEQSRIFAVLRTTKMATWFADIRMSADEAPIRNQGR